MKIEIEVQEQFRYTIPTGCGCCHNEPLYTTDLNHIINEIIVNKKLIKLQHFYDIKDYILNRFEIYRVMTFMNKQNQLLEYDEVFGLTDEQWEEVINNEEIKKLIKQLTSNFSI